LLFAEPAVATSCDERAIAASSVEAAAESIWANSDVIGFARVESANTAGREQQFVDLLVALKGEAARYPYVPLRIGRTKWMGPGLTRLPARDGEILFVTLVRTERGYLVPACQDLVVGKDPTAIIRRLAAIARERR
jgi:hypothetical protein